ncbi:MAG: hypothetical protein WDM77_11260 [Steroidobacteraceae bacterium]
MRFSKALGATAIAIAALIFSGCADVSGSEASTTTAAPAPDPQSMVSGVTVEFDANMQALAASDPRLTTAAIAIAIENELRAQQLYAPAAASVHRTLSVSVEDFTNTLAGDTSVLGFASHNLVLLGEVQVKGEPPPARPPFEVHARARFTSRGGSTSGSLAELYETFAILTVANLRSIETSPQSPPP